MTMRMLALSSSKQHGSHGTVWSRGGALPGLGFFMSSLVAVGRGTAGS